MEEQKKKKVSKFSVVCWVIGVCLIIVGIVLPQIMFKTPKYTFSVDADPFGSYYEFEVDINENVNTDTAVAKIKIDGVKTQSFKLDYVLAESEYGEYVFKLELDDENASMFNEVVELEITASSGRVIVFENEDKYDDFGANSKKIILTVFPVFFGVFFIVMGLAINVAKKSAKYVKKVNDKIMDNLFGEDEEKQKNVETSSSSTITCKYCGLENDNSSAKCEHCGAPLIRKKK